jgi:predicted DNA-binding transcriptional regulator YafY
MAKKKKKKSKKAIPPGRTTPVPPRPDGDRRVQQNVRIARVLRVLNLIQSRGRWNLKSIAEELEWSERTIRRDLGALELAGVPWYKDADRTIRVRPDYKFPALALTEDEALGQALATAISKAPGLNVGAGASPTTRKLAASSSEHLQEILADARRLIEVFDLKLADHGEHQEAIKTIQLALLQGKRLTGVYKSPYEPKPLRLVVHPYRLCLVKRAWYVVGRVEGETAPKTLRAARFKTLRALDEPASTPEDFDLRKYFGNAWSVYRGDKTHRVELAFAPEAAGVVTETVWHHTQKAKRHADGSATLSFTVDGLDEILHWILSWAGRVRVRKPEELRELFVQTLEDAARMNSEPENL